MDHWARKHACDIAFVAGERSSSSALLPDCRNAFEQVGMLARSAAKGRPEGGADNLDALVSALCSACLAAGLDCRCGGRQHWQQPCNLVAARVVER